MYKHFLLFANYKVIFSYFQIQSAWNLKTPVSFSIPMSSLRCFLKRSVNLTKCCKFGMPKQNSPKQNYGFCTNLLKILRCGHPSTLTDTLGICSLKTVYSVHFVKCTVVFLSNRWKTYFHNSIIKLYYTTGK